MIVDGSLPLRAEFSETVLMPWGTRGSLVPAEGVKAEPWVAYTDGSDAILSSAWAESDPVSNIPAESLYTDESGSVSYYLDPRDYNIHFSDTHDPARFSPYVRGFSSVSSGISADAASLSATLQNLEALKWQQYSSTISGTDVVSSTVFQAYGDEMSFIPITGTSLVLLWYEAIWAETVVGASRAAVVVSVPFGNSQVTTYGNGGPVTISAGRGATNAANQWGKLVSSPIGLVSTSAPAYTNDGINGQALAIDLASTDQISYSVNGGTVIYNPTTSTSSLGGPITMLIAPGTGQNMVDFSIQYMVSSGTASIKNRTMHIMVAPF